MLSRDWLKAFLPIGVLKQPDNWISVGAGVLFSQPPVLWFVTTAHVVDNQGSNHLAILVGRKDRGVHVVDLTDLHRRTGTSWQWDRQHDLAITLMPVMSDFDIKAVDQNVCLSVRDAVPSMQCYTVGCPYGQLGFDPTSVTPLVQDGIIAGVDEPKNHLYITAPTFPGNSGGPLIAVRSPITPGGGMIIGKPVVFFAGVVRQYAVVRPDVPELPNNLPGLHLGIATSSDAVISLIESDMSKAQIDLISSS